MATKRSQEGNGAERSDRGNDIWNKEEDLRETGSRVSYRAAWHHWRDLGELSITLETPFLALSCSVRVFILMCECVLVSLSAHECACARSCVWACCFQRQTCPRGRKTLEIGYCITEAIYLFWGLTYLIPLLNPVGINALTFPIIWLSVTQRESGLLLLPVTGFSMQVAEL